MKTSYYAKYKKFPENALLMRISRGVPRFYPGNYEPMSELFPPDTLRGMDLDEFFPAYWAHLDAQKAAIIGRIGVYKQGADFDGREIIFLCFEKIDNFDDSFSGSWCHREIFAEWWLENTGEVIEELT